jgi:hypothetical protein
LTRHRAQDGQPLCGNLDAALTKTMGGVEFHSNTLSILGVIPKFVRLFASRNNEPGSWEGRLIWCLVGRSRTKSTGNP